jgi:predicted nucleic acid-binding protein
VIVLDTNIVSSLMRERPDANVVAWLDQLPPTSVWITAITVFELRYGIDALAPGQRRDQLEREFARVLDTDIEGRILPLDFGAATTASSIAAMRRRAGRPVEIRDTLIAGIVVSQGADFATRNVRHFEDLDVRVVNPWADAAG